MDARLVPMSGFSIGLGRFPLLRCLPLQIPCKFGPAPRSPVGDRAIGHGGGVIGLTSQVLTA